MHREKQGHNETRRADGRSESKHETERYEPQAATENQGHYLLALSAERHAQADFVRPLRNRVGKQRVKTHCRKQQRDASKRSREPRCNARENQRRAERGIHRGEKSKGYRAVERGDRGAHGRLQRRRVAVGAYDEGANRLRKLAKRHIHFVGRGLIEIGALHVGYHADDFTFDFAVAAAEQNFSESRFAVEESLRERFVDDANLWGLVVVAFVEYAAFAERDAHRREIMFAHSVEPGTCPFGLRWNGLAPDRVSCARLKSRKRHIVADGGALDLRQRFEALGQLREEFRLLRFRRIARRVCDADVRRRDAVRLETRLRVSETDQTH